MPDNDKNKGQMDVDKVLTPERFMDYETEILQSPLVDLAIERIDHENMEVCDIGGASGVFLGELLKRARHPFNATLLEVMPDYREHMVDKRINFRLASILDNDIPDESFDIITFRHIVHHLVADNIETTLKNQQRAFEQIFRLIKPGGYVIFQEQVHYVKIFSRMVYRMSLLANKMSLKSRFFDAGTVVVAFPTPQEIESYIRSNTNAYGLDIEKYIDQPRNMPLRWKLTLLMKNVGDVTYAVKVGNKNT